MKGFTVYFDGAIDLKADSPEEAEKQVRDLLYDVGIDIVGDVEVTEW